MQVQVTSSIRLVVAAGKLVGFHAAISVAATQTTSLYSHAGTYWFDRPTAPTSNSG
jgi:hypothetical protein